MVIYRISYFGVVFYLAFQTCTVVELGHLHREMRGFCTTQMGYTCCLFSCDH